MRSYRRVPASFKGFSARRASLTTLSFTALTASPLPTTAAIVQDRRLYMSQAQISSRDVHLKAWRLILWACVVTLCFVLGLAAVRVQKTRWTLQQDDWGGGPEAAIMLTGPESSILVPMIVSGWYVRYRRRRPFSPPLLLL